MKQFEGPGPFSPVGRGDRPPRRAGQAAACLALTHAPGGTASSAAVHVCRSSAWGGCPRTRSAGADARLAEAVPPLVGAASKSTRGSPRQQDPDPHQELCLPAEVARLVLHWSSWSAVASGRLSTLARDPEVAESTSVAVRRWRLAWPTGPRGVRGGGEPLPTLGRVCPCSGWASRRRPEAGPFAISNGPASETASRCPARTRTYASDRPQRLSPAAHAAGPRRPRPAAITGRPRRIDSATSGSRASIKTRPEATADRAAQVARSRPPPSRRDELPGEGQGLVVEASRASIGRGSDECGDGLGQASVGGRRSGPRTASPAPTHPPEHEPQASRSSPSRRVG